jgi:hypothetical protein
MVNGGIYRPATMFKTKTGAKIPGKRVFKAATSARMRQMMRMIVVDGPGRREESFYNALGEWEKNGGPAALMKWLLTYDLRGWTPPKHAPMTAEKHMAYMENLSPIQRVAEDMQTADDKIVKTWIQTAMIWAQAAEGGPNAIEAKLARDVKAALGTIQIRPWYTADELAHMFPAIVGQLYGTKKTDATPAGEISRSLRNAGVPYLRNKDDHRGFMWHGRWSQFLVVAMPEDYGVPIGLAYFDRMMAEWPTYKAVASGLQRGQR